MKIKPITKILCLSLILNCSVSVYSQIENDDIPEQVSEDFDKSFLRVFNTMIKNAKLIGTTNKKPCKVEDLLKKIDVSKHGLNMSGSISMFNLYTLIADRNAGRLPLDKIDKGNFKTINDKALNALSNTTNFSDFVYAFTGKDIGEFKGSLDPSDEYTELGTLKWYYSSYKSTLLESLPVDRMNYTSDGCSVNLNSKLLFKKLDFPNIEYTLKTEVIIKCYCYDDKNLEDIKSGILEYEADIKGIFTSSKISFNEVIQPKVKLKSIECCPAQEKKEEPTETALNDGIEDLMPDQTIGLGAGVGFAQDFDETTFCITGEYLYQINSNEEKGLYVGAEVSHQNTSFGDFKSNKTMAGGKFQYNFSATPSGETQFVAGLMANYAFGSNENNGFNDDYTGTIFCAYGGANIRVSENWSIGLQFPFLIFENYTFEPEFGDDFKVDATSLFNNKNNPLKIIVRRRL